jgi:tetratricopeptide (TPR) repeat protein
VRGLPLLACLLLASVPAARADRLVLERGGTIEVDHWWIEGSTLWYEGPAGAIGIPRSLVVRIERSGEGAAEPGWESMRPPRQLPPDAAPETPSPPRTQLELLEHGRAALLARDFATASGAFERLLQADPLLRPARVGLAVARLAEGRDSEALPVVTEGLALDPASPELHELMGDLRDREERMEDALRSWKEAYRLVPGERLAEKIRRAERELEAGRDYLFAATAHFNLRYDGRLDPRLAAEIADYLETRYRDLTGHLRHAPARPITVLLYPSQEFRDVTRAPEGIDGLYDGKIRLPLGGLRKLDPRARGLLSHELAHAVLNSKTRGNCPRWLHEGLAQRFEGRPSTRAERVRLARHLAAGGAPFLPEPEIFYPASLSFTTWLEVRRGWQGLVELLERLGEGHHTDEALRTVYGLAGDELEQEWRNALLREEPGR